MKSKTLTLAATAIAAALAMSAMPAQAELPKLAGGPAAAAPAAGQTLTHANGYSVTVPSDWVVATDIEGTDFMMGNADLSIICQTFSATGLDMQATDEQIKAELSTGDLGQDFYTKLLFDGAPELAYVSTGPQPDHPGGWPFQRAIATAKIDNTPHTAYAYATFKAKTLFAGYCFTESAKLEAGKAAMDNVINSIRINK